MAVSVALGSYAGLYIVGSALSAARIAAHAATALG